MQTRVIDYLIYIVYYVQHSTLYWLIMYYIVCYPLFGGIAWTWGNVLYRVTKEQSQPLPDLSDPIYLCRVSIIISVFNEEHYIRMTLDSCLALNYPNYEIVVVNDGSTDNTLPILEEYATKGLIRLISKDINQGKAIAMNDALICIASDIILYIDADVELDPDVIINMIPHFKHPRLAAVAGNPRIKNSDNFLCRMQVLEYASVIGTIRRTQRIWGRIMTFSGSIFMIRKTAIYDVGGFDPNAPTEDIALAWGLQRRFWDIFYEPKAVAWVITPHTYFGFIKQRLRWSRGLMSIIGRNIDMLFRWKMRRMWPVIIENILSQFWVLSAGIVGILWIMASLLGYQLWISFYPPLIGGLTITTINIVAQFVAIQFDKQYDPQLKHLFFYTIYFSIYYWIFLAVIAFVELPRVILQPKPTLGWKNTR